MLVNRISWLQIAGWTSRYFDSAVGKGFPVRKRPSTRGEDWEIDTSEGIAWIVAQRLEELERADSGEVLDLNAQRARLAKEQVDKTSMENDKARGRLADVEELRLVLEAQDVAIKDRLLAVPTAAADRALDASRARGARGIAKVYDEAIRAALRSLASAKVVSGLAS
jgi:phage terminase Nu1 subunit (DNA packaging protein)